MVEFRTLIIIGLLTGLFAFSLINFSVTLTNDNNATNIVMENDAINDTFGELGTELASEQDKGNSSKTLFESDIPLLGTDSFLFNSIIGVGKVFTGIWRNMYNLTFGLLADTLGISSVVLGVITTILLLTIILLAWGLYKTGR